jgi:hypothetical protein
MIYPLKVIISVGYAVDSYRATQFKDWATEIIKSFTTKGFAINENLINNSGTHYTNLIDKIQALRASERHVYDKLKECFKLCSIDYDPNSQIAKDFFATIQNKFHYAITGRTSAEIIKDRANASQPNMGLQTWKETNIRKSDVTIAKNYLGATELDELQHVVFSYLEMAKNFAYRKKDIKMADWITKLDSLINQFEYQLLEGGGSVTSDYAKAYAERQYKEYKGKYLTA